MRARPLRLSHPSAGEVRDLARREKEGTPIVPDGDDLHHLRHRHCWFPIDYVTFTCMLTEASDNRKLHSHDGCRNVCNYRYKSVIASDSFKDLHLHIHHIRVRLHATVSSIFPPETISHHLCTCHRSID